MDFLILQHKLDTLTNLRRFVKDHDWEFYISVKKVLNELPVMMPVVTNF